MRDDPRSNERGDVSRRRPSASAGGGRRNVIGVADDGVTRVGNGFVSVFVEDDEYDWRGKIIVSRDRSAAVRSPAPQETPEASEVRDEKRAASSPKRSIRRFGLAAALSLLAVGGSAIGCYFAFFQREPVAERRLAPVAVASTSKAPVVDDTWAELTTRRAGTQRSFVVGDGVQMDFVWAPAGGFMMGSSTAEPDREPDEIQHKVEISRGFWILEVPVTVGMWRAFVAATGYECEKGFEGRGGRRWRDRALKNVKEKNLSLGEEYTWENPGFVQDDSCPVTEISYGDSIAFCSWISEVSGLECRFPTEAEWEYACRAGARRSTRFYYGDDEAFLVRHGNVGDRSLVSRFPHWNGVNADDGFVFTSPVRRFEPNAWGLYDMLGNVQEWCLDGYARYETGEGLDPIVDPVGPDDGYRVQRGGSWRSRVRRSRCAYRFAAHYTAQMNNAGLRVVLHAPGEDPVADRYLAAVESVKIGFPIVYDEAPESEAETEE